ncbi:MAG: histidine phosphatase family protein [Fidelibacterota bacterium]
MKTITLIRHAKSSWDYNQVADFGRPLNERGLKSAPIMGRDLRKQGFSFERIFTSGAVRTYHTAVLIAYELGIPSTRIKVKRELYQCTTGKLLSFIQSRKNNQQDIAIVGHYPSLPQTAELLTGELLDKFPTCAVVRIDFDSTDWSQISPGTGRIAYFQYPKNLPDYHVT